MFMKKQNKKRGFTITELVVVIAVIAILSAVLIPTFSGIIKKSKESADQQAVRQMNTVLTQVVLEDDADIQDVFAILDEADINAENYQALYKNRFFFYDTELQKVVYAEYKNGSYVALYPADIKDKTDAKNWVTLSGELGKADVKDVVSGTTASPKTAEQLVAVMTSIAQNKDATKNVTEVNLEANKNYNLKGADISIKSANKNLAITGNGATLAGAVNAIPARGDVVLQQGGKRNYAAGLIGTVGAAKNPVNVTISNLTIENTVFGENNINFVGLVSAVYGGSEVTFDNVKVTNSTFKGMDKVGVFVGFVSDGTVTINSNCSVSNTTVECSEGHAGGIFGIIQKGTVKAANAEALTATTTVKVDKVSGATYLNYARTEDGLVDTTVTLDMQADFSIDTDDGITYNYVATCARYGFCLNKALTPITLTGVPAGKTAYLKYGSTAFALGTAVDGYYTWTK